MKSLISAFHQAIRERALFKSGETVVVAVSGGSDSVALLRLICIARKQLDLRLVVAHVNHGLRGRASDADEAFVRKLASSFSLPVRCKKIPVGALLSKRGASLEESARDARYRFLQRTAKACGATKVATAHTRDDQAETVLMRLLRGAGLRGLVGIPIKRNCAGVCIVRPLLSIEKSKLIRFLAEQRLTYRIDTSNTDNAFFRNKIRNELMPFIRKGYSRSFDKNLVELSSIAGDVYEHICSEARRIFNRSALLRSGSVRLLIAPLKRTHTAPRSEVFFLALERIAGSRKGFDKPHITALEGLVTSALGLRVSLPHRVVACREKKSIVLSIKRV